MIEIELSTINHIIRHGDQLKIEIKKFKDVNRAPYNPRVELKAGMSEYEKLKKSVETFGHVLPMVYNQKSGTLVGGHQTMTVLEDLGRTEAEMSIVDLNEVEEKALNIALNKIGGMFDNEKLSDILNELIEIPDFDIELTGFTLDEIGEIDLQLPTPDNVVSDSDLPTQTTETDIKIGDIITLGKHKLLCGDALDKTEIVRLIEGADVDLLYYDPPYESKECWDCFYDCNKALIFTDNRHILDAYFIISKFKHVYEFVWDTAVSWYLENRPLCRHRSAYLCQNVPEYNSDGAIFDDGKIRTKHNVTTHKGNYEYQPLENGVRLSSIYQKNKAQLQAQYGKPIEWIAPIIAGACATNVLDLFGGSGSTLMACEQLGITCCVVEIDPVKCQNIVNRFESR